MNTNVMFSSKSNEWSTPPSFFNEVNKEFNFNLDPCSTDENHKCDKYYTIKDDGLSKDWSGHNVWCNPPYGRNIGKWVEKCYREGCKDNTLVALLIPARTDTKYFHDYILHRAEIRFIPGRLKFGNSNNSAPFPSMLVIFRGAKVR